MRKQNDKEVLWEYKADKLRCADTAFIKTEEDHLEIHFATVDKTEGDKIKFTIIEKMALPAVEMKDFCLTLMGSLLDYEDTYKNGLGLQVSENLDEEDAK